MPIFSKKISPRETEVLGRMAVGECIREISEHLGISKNTVLNCVMFASAKLGGGRTPGVVHAAYIHEQLPRPKSDERLNLHARQVAIIECISLGLSMKEMANKLGYSSLSMRLNVNELFRRLDAKNASHAVTRAWELGILQCERS
ncbi:MULTISPECIES: LuxR C-terminal-related transcriptional regulator [unclassified Streptomyces]|uniref:LuxR C-terminal-related transcriptional regulator n=1 Tax=unclassified Streptomyces TaxID=2593676 RepID=UPI0009A4CD10|nr:LuxR C-terminal-related transcriptional regulator [Streptomyces sp. 3211]